MLVVQTLDSSIHWKNSYPEDKRWESDWVIHWIEINPVDSLDRAGVLSLGSFMLCMLCFVHMNKLEQNNK